MKATVSLKGQVTIPIELREKLGLYPGQKLDFEIRGSELVAKKVKVDKTAKFRGYLKKRTKLSVDNYIDEVRG
jgi:AbrB family looped-hinge helix DNA binding protein